MVLVRDFSNQRARSRIFFLFSKFFLNQRKNIYSREIRISQPLDPSLFNSYMCGQQQHIVCSERKRRRHYQIKNKKHDQNLHNNYIRSHVFSMILMKIRNLTKAYCYKKPWSDWQKINNFDANNYASDRSDYVITIQPNCSTNIVPY